MSEINLEAAVFFESLKFVLTVNMKKSVGNVLFERGHVSLAELVELNDIEQDVSRNIRLIQMLETRTDVIYDVVNAIVEDLERQPGNEICVELIRQLQTCEF